MHRIELRVSLKLSVTNVVQEKVEQFEKFASQGTTPLPLPLLHTFPLILQFIQSFLA